MPLEKGSSKEVISHNISAERYACKPEKQAVAIAMNKSREKDKSPGTMCPNCGGTLERVGSPDRATRVVCPRCAWGGPISKDTMGSTMQSTDYRKRMHGALDRMLDSRDSKKKDGGPGSGPQKGSAHARIHNQELEKNGTAYGYSNKYNELDPGQQRESKEYYKHQFNSWL